MIDGQYINARLREKLEALEDELGLEFYIARNETSVVPEDVVVIQAILATASPGFVAVTAGARNGLEDETVYIYDIYRPATTLNAANFVNYQSNPVAVLGPKRYDSLIGLSRAIWDDICDEFIEEVVLEPIRRVCDPEFIELQQQAIREARRQAIEELAVRTFTRQINALRTTIDGHAHQLVEYQNYIATTTATLRDKQRELDVAMQLQQNGPADKFVAEFEQLESHPRVASLEVITTHNNIIRITTTDDIRLTHPVTGESRWLGAFRVELNLSNLTVSLRNLSTRRADRDHPHVVDGSPCLGGHHAAFLELLNRGQFFVWWDCLIQFLETLNPEDSWGAYASLWFEVPDEHPLEVEEPVAA